MNGWVRLWHDMPTDPKWRVIARKSKCSIAEVIAVYTFLLVNASANATERGRTINFDSEDVAAALDMEDTQIESILNAMQGKVLEGEFLTGWEKRQPKREREDANSASRSKAWRERKKLEKETNDKERHRTPPNATERLDTDTDTDTDTDIKNKHARKKNILFSEFIKQCQEQNEKPIPEGDGVFKIAEQSGVTNEMLKLCWLEFADKYSGNSKKKYTDWRQVFQNCVRDNWYKLWYADHDGNILLTSEGRMAENRQRAA